MEWCAPLQPTVAPQAGTQNWMPSKTDRAETSCNTSPVSLRRRLDWAAESSQFVAKYYYPLATRFSGDDNRVLEVSCGHGVEDLPEPAKQIDLLPDVLLRQRLRRIASSSP